MKTLFRAALASIFIIYPLLIYFGIQVIEPKYLGGGILCLLGVRVWLMKKSTKQVFNMKPVLLLGGALALCGTLFNSLSWFLYYPAVINVVFLAVFVRSLFYPPTIVERFALLTGEQPSPELSRYTKKVTIVWCCFFIVNTGISLYTSFFASLETWTLYNGLIAYILMGVLFAVEYLVRPRHSSSQA